MKPLKAVSAVPARALKLGHVGPVGRFEAA